MIIIISLILILLSLAIASLIIVKKFPALAILDVENIPKEKEAKFKDVIIKNRIERDLANWSGIIGRFFLRLSKQVSSTLEKASDNLKKMKLGHKIAEKLPHHKKEKLIKNLMLVADNAIKSEEYAIAEEKLVEIISFDQKNVMAFFKLGEVYKELRKYPESRQTLEYVLKISRRNREKEFSSTTIKSQDVYFALADLEERTGNIEAAYQNISEALEFDPNNPRFLDLILNLSIIKKDKDLATKYLERLAEANPENQKLKEREVIVSKL